MLYIMTIKFDNNIQIELINILQNLMNSNEENNNIKDTN